MNLWKWRDSDGLVHRVGLHPYTVCGRSISQSTEIGLKFEVTCLRCCDDRTLIVPQPVVGRFR